MALFSRAIGLCRRGLAAAISLAGRYNPALLGLCCVAILWAGVLTSLSIQRNQAVHAAEQNTDNLARAFEESIIRSIRAVEQTLRYVRIAYLHDPAGFDPDQWALNSPFPVDLVFQISIINRDGYLVTSSIGGSANRIYLGDREHFRVHAERGTDDLFISKPVIGQVSGKWSIQLTRPIITADGSFGGVAVVSLDPEYLTRFYQSVDLGGDGVALLVGLDGIIRARASATPTPLGQSLAGGVMLQHHEAARSGRYLTKSPVDGITRHYAYREVQDFRLIFAVGMSEPEVMAAYRETSGCSSPWPGWSPWCCSPWSG